MRVPSGSQHSALCPRVRQNSLMSEREIFSSGGKWERVIGFSRAVKVGRQVWVAGTTAADANGKVEGDAYAQTIATIKNIEKALWTAGSSLEDVVRSTVYVTNIKRDSEAVGRAHGEFFANIRPAMAMIGVSSFIIPEMLVEITVDAVIPDEESQEEL